MYGKLRVHRRDGKPLGIKTAKAIDIYVRDKFNIQEIDEDIITKEDTEDLRWTVEYRWAIPETELRELAIKFKVKVDARGEEDGMCFYQVMNVDEDGAIINNESIDWYTS